MPPLTSNWIHPSARRATTVVLALGACMTAWSLGGCSASDARITSRAVTPVHGLGPDACPVARFPIGPVGPPQPAAPLASVERRLPTADDVVWTIEREEPSELPTGEPRTH